ncbi:hypothetical protein [Bacillus thuringiensis]|nr:hypothetical protein [Bacillus thuringiensis]
MGKIVTKEGTEWAMVPWRHLPRGKAYKFKFSSKIGQLVKFKHETVYYS